MSIGANIKKLLESQGMTQEQFGKIANATGKAVSTWENDLKVPRMGTIQLIADYFGLMKSDIIENEINDKYIRLKKDPQAEEFLSLYSALPPEKRRMAWAMLKGLSDNQ